MICRDIEYIDIYVIHVCIVKWYNHAYHIYIIIYKKYLVGGFNPSDKYESQLEWWFPIYYGQTQNVPNHQPVYIHIYIHDYTDLCIY